jgi:hypothetical protein
MRFLSPTPFTFAFALALSLTPLAARADNPPVATGGIVLPASSPARPPAPETSAELLHTEFGFYAPALSNAAFEGTFTLAGQTAAQSVRATGANLGFRQPYLFTADFEPLNFSLGHHVMWGGYFGLGSGGSDAPPSSPPPGVAVDHTLTMARGGLQVAGVWSVGPVEFRAGLRGGLRTFWVSAPNTVMTCTDTSRTSSGTTVTTRRPCEGTLSTGGAYLEPRAAVAVSVTKHTTLGVYAGADLIPSVSFEAGAFVSLQTRAFRRMAAIFRSARHGA